MDSLINTLFSIILVTDARSPGAAWDDRVRYRGSGISSAGFRHAA
jgi:hypothetical protein